MSLDLSFEQTVGGQWQVLAEIAEQVRELLSGRRSKTISRNALITRLSQEIDMVDGTLAQGADILVQLDELETNLVTVDAVEFATVRAGIPAVRKQIQEQQSIALTLRAQLMEMMIQLNPEDAWVYEPKNLATLHRAIADADAGRVTRYYSDEEFMAALARVPVNADA